MVETIPSRSLCIGFHAGLNLLAKSQSIGDDSIVIVSIWIVSHHGYVRKLFMELEGTEEASITACRYLPGCRERQVSEFKKGNDMPDSSAYLSVPALACQGSIARSYIGPIRLYKQAYSLPYLWG